MKVLAIAAVSARHLIHARGEAVARAVLYVVILLVFSRLWTVLEGSAALGGLSAASFVWYLAITECVTLAVPLLYASIEEDVRSGEVAYRIARPVSYLWVKLGEGAGDALVRVLMLAAVGTVAAWGFAGGPPPDPRALLLALPLVVLAVAVMVVVQVAIGLSAFWLQEAAPVFWIWQKVLFVLGGLMFPIEIYPQWLQTIARWTPCEPLLHGCGRMAFAYDPQGALLVALRLVAWGAAALALATWLYRRGLRVLDVNGG